MSNNRTKYAYLNICVWNYGKTMKVVWEISLISFMLFGGTGDDDDDDDDELFLWYGWPTGDDTE